MITIDLCKMGDACREHRETLGFSLNQVAIQTGYSKSNVGYFERGENNNASLLLWYMEKGLTISKLREMGAINNGN